MTKSELIDVVAARAGIATACAEAVVDGVFAAMMDALRRGDGIEIRSFGSMSVRRYSARVGRNPRTGAKVHVEEKRLPFFKVGKELRALVDASRHLGRTGHSDADEP